MAHGYLGDGYGSHGEIDPDRNDERERDWREREWRGRREHDRGSMFGDWDRDRSGDDRWREQRGYGTSYNRPAEARFGQQRFSAHPDDHYRSWRDRHMSELDRDYAEYCREREQQFHRDFDSWRSNRGQRSSDLTGQAGELELTQESALAEVGNMPSPVENATLGTNNSENSTPGRGSRQR